MRAGKLRHLLTILAPKRSATGLGDELIGYEVKGQVWGSLEPLSGRELFFAQGVKADVDTKITVRYTGELTEEHRITWNGKTYELGPPLSTEEKQIDQVFTATEVKRGPSPTEQT